MRRIAIVGAGQSGLQLGLGLLDTGYDVTMITNRTADEIRQGKVMSSQCMFHTALQTERDLGLNFWEEQCPAVEGIGLALVNPENGGKAFENCRKDRNECTLTYFSSGRLLILPVNYLSFT